MIQQEMQDPDNWEKVLWKRHAYPDNYVPRRSFLASLQTNPNFRPYTYWPLVILSCSITQHLAVIFIFLPVFVRLKEHTLDPRSLVCISVLCFFLGYVFWNVSNSPEEGTEHHVNHLKILKPSIMMFLALMSLSPVLRTLTAATSSDSIWALSAVLFILNALLADYTATEFQGAREGLSSVLSMNAAVSASVVLASRLTTDVSVFALMLFSIQSFALFPMLRHRLQAKTKFTTIFSALPMLTEPFSFSLGIFDLLVGARDDWSVYTSRMASRRPLAYGYVVVCRHFVVYYLNCAGCPDMGAAAQKHYPRPMGCSSAKG